VENNNSICTHVSSDHSEAQGHAFREEHARIALKTITVAMPLIQRHSYLLLQLTMFPIRILPDISSSCELQCLNVVLQGSFLIRVGGNWKENSN